MLDFIRVEGSKNRGNGIWRRTRVDWVFNAAPVLKERAAWMALNEGLLANRFLLLYGDTFMDVDLRKFWMAHEFSGAVGTLFLHPNDHPQDSDLESQLNHPAHQHAAVSRFHRSRLV